MKFLKALDMGVSGVLEIICGICQVLIVVIILIQVFSRNILSLDVGLIANFPVPLMIVSMWFGGVLTARKRRHITVPLLAQFVKNKRVIDGINIVMNMLVAAALAFFSYKGFYYCLVTLASRGTTDPATRLPMWTTHLVVPVACALMAIYYVACVVQDVKGGLKK